MVRGSEGVPFGALASAIRQAGIDPEQRLACQQLSGRVVASSRAAWRDSAVAAIVDLAVGEEAMLDGLDNRPLHLTAPGPARACPSRSVVSSLARAAGERRRYAA